MAKGSTYCRCWTFGFNCCLYLRRFCCRRLCCCCSHYGCVYFCRCFGWCWYLRLYFGFCLINYIHVWVILYSSCKSNLCVWWIMCHLIYHKRRSESWTSTKEEETIKHSSRMHTADLTNVCVVAATRCQQQGWVPTHWTYLTTLDITTPPPLDIPSPDIPNPPGHTHLPPTEGTWYQGYPPATRKRPGIRNTHPLGWTRNQGYPLPRRQNERH